jgi:hypothetical protein
MHNRFQDGRRHHVGNSSECYKTGNYHPIFMQVGTQIENEKHMLKLKITKAEVQAEFQDGRSRHSGQSSALYKLGNYHAILMKIDTQTKKNMLKPKITKAEV